MNCPKCWVNPSKVGAYLAGGSRDLEKYPLEKGELPVIMRHVGAITEKCDLYQCMSCERVEIEYT